MKTEYDESYRYDYSRYKREFGYDDKNYLLFIREIIVSWACLVFRPEDQNPLFFRSEKNITTRNRERFFDFIQRDWDPSVWVEEE